MQKVFSDKITIPAVSPSLLRQPRGSLALSMNWLHVSVDRSTKYVISFQQSRGETPSEPVGMVENKGKGFL
jgi:hypothetical protein